MADHEDDVDAGAKIAETGFQGEHGPTDDEVNRAQLEREARLRALKEKLDEELRVAMRKNIEMVLKELEDGTLHGLIMVRVNDQHQVASSIAVCNVAVNEVGSKLQEIAMDLMLPAGAAREIRGLMELLAAVGKRRS